MLITWEDYLWLLPMLLAFSGVLKLYERSYELAHASWADWGHRNFGLPGQIICGLLHVVVILGALPFAALFVPFCVWGRVFCEGTRLGRPL